ncbi:FAD-dependent oxidoreductase [Nostoc sp. NMS8]|nr:FAD-dependent oxidoreductase [Nostoc sp. NMS8]MBN3958099.1 NAD(P)-binding protein [Nostoc sp. NMS8]
MESYDVVIIGAGHNGLVCAGYLLKAGYSVLLLEGRSLRNLQRQLLSY